MLKRLQKLVEYNFRLKQKTITTESTENRTQTRPFFVSFVSLW